MDIERLHPRRGRGLCRPRSRALAVAALVLLVIVALSLGQAIMSANLTQKIVRLLDQSLLILMIVEILYTLQVSFREHTLVAEPFLIVGLIAAIRCVLILTANSQSPPKSVKLHSTT
jgi:uncharacterized membrane protein (DUF373 family)